MKCATCGTVTESANPRPPWINGIEGPRCPPCNDTMNRNREASLVLTGHALAQSLRRVADDTLRTSNFEAAVSCGNCIAPTRAST